MPYDPTVKVHLDKPEYTPPVETVESGYDPSASVSIGMTKDRSPFDTNLGGTPLNSVFTEKNMGTPGTYPSASAGTSAKAYTVDDPYTKIKIFSKDRGLPVDRYGIHEGDIVFLGDDGKIHHEETTKTFPGFMKQMSGPAAQIGTEVGIIGGAIAAAPATMGASLALPFAAGGAVEAGRKTIGAMAFDEPIDGLEIAKDIATESALAGFGDLAMRGILNVASKARNLPAKGMLPKKTRAAVKLAGESGYTPEIGAAYEVWGEAMEKYGIDLNLAQASQSHEIANVYKLLRDLPETTSKVIKNDLAQDLQIERSAFDLFEALGKQTDNAMAGAKVVDAANGALKAAKSARSDAVRPLYKRAFSESSPVDTTNAIQRMDKLISELPTGSSDKTALENLKGMFYEADGTAVKSLEKVDMVKRNIDSIMSGSHPLSDQFVKSTKADLFRRMNLVRRDMVTAADEASAGLYKEARDKFIELTPGVEQARQSVLGQVAKLEGDQVARASKMLLDSNTVTPVTAKRTFNYLRSIDPDAADSAITSYLSSSVDAIKADQTGYVRNVGGKLYQKLFGSEKQRNILKAVMHPEKYNDLKDFMTVMRKAGITSGKESMTEPRRQMSKLMESEAESVALKAKGFLTSPVESFKSTLEDTARTALNAEYRGILFDAIGSGRYADKIRQLKKMNPRTERYARALSFTLTQMLAVPVAQEISRAGRPETAIGQAESLRVPIPGEQR